MRNGRWNRDAPLIAQRTRVERERTRALALFAATCLSVFCVHLFGWQPAGAYLEPNRVGGSLLFAGTLLSILLAHEFGHYTLALHHGFRLSLPMFLPAPVLTGTFGAIIRIESAPPSRQALLEMGAGGPLAGLLATLLVVGVRLLWGEPSGVVASDWTLTSPALLAAVGIKPVPTDPLAFAAWIGCLVTFMNLLPLGQLDGGHVAGACLPGTAALRKWTVTVLLLLMGVVWAGWAVWIGVLHLMGATDPLEPKAEEEQLTPRARWMAAGCFAAFVVTAMPVPVF